MDRRKQCQKCTIDHCWHCQTERDVAECEWCDSGYYSTTKNTCYECTVENCRYCENNSDVPICGSCNDGFFLNEKRKCAECTTPHCLMCEEQATEPWCWYFVPGYVAKDGQCIRDKSGTDEACLKYAEAELKKKCVHCADGYVLNEQG